MRKSAIVVVAVSALGLLTGGAAPGAASAPGDTTVHRPTAISDVAVPDVRGERPAVARQIMEGTGFRVDIQGGTGRGPHGGQCVVGDQTPAPGIPAPVGSTVTLRTAEVGGSPQPC